MFIEIEITTIQRGVVKTQVMTTGYGSTYYTKRQNILTALKEQGIELDPADAGIVVAACVEGMELAFPKYAALNQWFKNIAKEIIKQGGEDIRWTSPNGSLIVQRYNEPLFKSVHTYCASGGDYSVLISDTKKTTKVINGYGDPIINKHVNATAANFTHTLDACMIQDGMIGLPQDINCVTVHDCFYSQPGYMSDIAPIFRKAFHNVVTTPVLEELMEVNKVSDDFEMIKKESADLSVSLDSQYLFS